MFVAVRFADLFRVLFLEERNERKLPDVLWLWLHMGGLAGYCRTKVDGREQRMNLRAAAIVIGNTTAREFAQVKCTMVRLPTMYDLWRSFNNGDWSFPCCPR